MKGVWKLVPDHMTFPSDGFLGGDAIGHFKTNIYFMGVLCVQIGLKNW